MTISGKALNKYSIEYTIQYEKPIELTQFSSSLSSFSAEYKKFIKDKYGSEQPSNAKLYIQNIKEGSIITTLVEYADLSIPFIGDVNTVFEFGKFLGSAFGYLKGDQTDKPSLDIKDLENLSQIISPGTSNNNSINITVNGQNNNILVLNANDEQSNAISNRIKVEKKELGGKQLNIHTKQAFYWYQAKREMSKTGNFGVIESISPNRLNVVFNDESIQAEMIKGDDNPFTKFYIVDVEVQFVREQPKVYKILKLHEVLDQ